jgi:DNA-binding NarL/FixJ family response regulator
MPHSVDRPSRTLTLIGVAACLLDGHSNKEIARAMGITRWAASRCVAELSRVHGARNRVALALALQEELMP